jgi:hypothetical protein
MSIWHFEIFAAEIWNEHNIKIIVQHYKMGITEEEDRVLTLDEITEMLENVSYWKDTVSEKHICGK